MIQYPMLRDVLWEMQEGNLMRIHVFVSLHLILECCDKARFLLLHFGLNIIMRD